MQSVSLEVTPGVYIEALSYIEAKLELFRHVSFPHSNSKPREVVNQTKSNPGVSPQLFMSFQSRIRSYSDFSEPQLDKRQTVSSPPSSFPLS